MKKLIKVLLVVMLVFIITGCDNHEENLTDAIKFKNEYEELNDTIREKDGKKIRSIVIDEDNPIIYKTAKDIIKMMDKKESFVVYFGFKDCPWCRSMITNLISVAKDLDIDSIYYVDVKEIRDTLKLDESGNVVTENAGTEDYYEIIERMSNVFEDYTLKDENDNTIYTGEKRIFAPNVVSVVEGVAISLTDGISDSQNDGYMKLTSDMNKESKNKIKCSIQCVSDSKKVCEAKASC